MAAREIRPTASGVPALFNRATIRSLVVSAGLTGMTKSFSLISIPSNALVILLPLNGTTETIPFPLSIAIVLSNVGLPKAPSFVGIDALAICISLVAVACCPKISGEETACKNVGWIVVGVGAVKTGEELTGAGGRILGGVISTTGGGDR